MKTDYRILLRLAYSLARKRIARFALVGGICIPLNLALLWLFHAVLRLPVVPAWILAFECSAFFNFYANQRFTYGEQRHVRGWAWPKRALKAQASSLVGVMINVSVFGALLAGRVPYLTADAAGIVAAFAANFLLADHFVFTAPARAAGDSHLILGNPLEQ
ncbi:MAG TPA: GtrA family protein [Chloroflexota bacterium]|nr:GtrA family protein [Chloroflexota bacterium]